MREIFRLETDMMDPLHVVSLIQLTLWILFLGILYFVASRREMRRERIVTLGLIGWSLVYMVPFLFVLVVIAYQTDPVVRFLVNGEISRIKRKFGK